MQAGTKFTIGVIGIALAMAGGGYAQAQKYDSDGLPYNEIEVTPDGVAYLTGGIGTEEQERFNAGAQEFNLKLVFTLNEGNYIADVNVLIKDEEGREIVKAIADGPFFMVKLSPARYIVEATFRGKTERRNIEVGGTGLRTAYLRWPSSPKYDFIVSRR